MVYCIYYRGSCGKNYELGLTVEIIKTREKLYEEEQLAKLFLGNPISNPYPQETLYFEGLTFENRDILDYLSIAVGKRYIFHRCKFNYIPNDKYQVEGGAKIQSFYFIIFRDCEFNNSTYTIHSYCGSSVLFLQCKSRGTLIIGDCFSEITIIGSDLNIISFDREACDVEHPKLKVVCSKINKVQPFSNLGEGELLFGLSIEEDTFDVVKSDIREIDLSGINSRNCFIRGATKGRPTIESLFWCPGVELTKICDNFVRCDLSNVKITNEMLGSLKYIRFLECNVTGMDLSSILPDTEGSSDSGWYEPTKVGIALSTSIECSMSITPSRCFEFIQCSGFDAIKLPDKCVVGSVDTTYSREKQPIIVV